jgi:hypothetical protein
MLPFFGAVGAIILGAILIILGHGDDSGDFRDKGKDERVWLFLPGHLLMWPGLLAAITFAIVWPSLYFASLGTVQALRGFAETRCVYVNAIQQAEAVVIIGAGEPATLDLTYQQQAGRFTDLVQQLRDRTEWYNRTLFNVQALKDNVFVGQFRVGPGDLTPIADPLIGCPD